jgi:hypothetical protein
MCLPLKTKIKSYFVFTTRLVFNFGWIAQIAASYKPGMHYVPTKSGLINELPQHCKSMHDAMIKGHIYVPSVKGSRYDGCIYDPLTCKVIKIIEYKTKEIGSVPITSKVLSRLYKKYATLDELNISFKSSEDLENSKGAIESAKEEAIGIKLNITYNDISSCLEEHTCLLPLPKIFANQIINNPIVQHVNQNLMNEFGIITDFMSV